LWCEKEDSTCFHRSRILRCVTKVGFYFSCEKEDSTCSRTNPTSHTRSRILIVLTEVGFYVLSQKYDSTSRARRKIPLVLTQVAFNFFSQKYDSTSRVRSRILLVITKEQPVPEKTRLRMVIEMQIKILNGGRILINCKFKLNQNLTLNLYREIQRNSNPIQISIRICTLRYRGI